jgi:Zn-dependent protease/predicted transcriptional regulator
MRDSSRPAVDTPELPSPLTVRSGLPLVRPFGVQIVADFSLVFILALIAINLGAGLLPSWHPGWQPWLRWTVAVGAAVSFFISVALHELSHALVARAQGMRVQQIRLFIFGGMAQVEGEPKSPRAEFVMAAVGPLTSLAIGIFCSWFGATLASIRMEDPVLNEPEAVLRSAGPLATLLIWLGPLNLLLAAFNMIPGFPLDGGRVFRSLIWWVTRDLHKATKVASGLGRFVAWTMMALGIFMVFGFAPLGLTANPVQGLWFLLIGWFLSHAARSSYQQHLLQQALEDVPVRDVMRAHVQAVPPDLAVAELVRSYVMNEEDSAFPVVEQEHVLGLVGRQQVRQIPRERWADTQVSDVMVPVAKLHVMGPEDDALDAVRHLADQEAVPVVDHERFIGLARRRDVLRWLSLQAAYSP